MSQKVHQNFHSQDQQNDAQQHDQTYDQTYSLHKIAYIYGKQYDKAQLTYYLCRTSNREIEWIRSDKISPQYNQLIINYEAYHSRLLFSELYHKYFQEKEQNTIVQQKKSDPKKEIITPVHDQTPIKRKREVRKDENPKKQIKKETNLINLESSNKSKSAEKKHTHTKPFITEINEKRYGNFNKDVPSHISNHRMDIKQLEKIQDNNVIQGKHQVQNYYYKVEWKNRNDGIRKKGQYYKYEELRKTAPRLMLDYFQKLGRLIR